MSGLRNATGSQTAHSFQRLDFFLFFIFLWGEWLFLFHFTAIKSGPLKHQTSWRFPHVGRCYCVPDKSVWLLRVSIFVGVEGRKSFHGQLSFCELGPTTCSQQTTPFPGISERLLRTVTHESPSASPRRSRQRFKLLCLFHTTSICSWISYPKPDIAPKISPAVCCSYELFRF